MKSAQKAKAVFLFPIALIFAVFVFSSCTTAIKIRDVSAVEEGNQAIKLPRGKIIYVAKVEDGSFNGKIYAGSGSSVANSFYVSLGQYASKTALGGINDYLTEAKTLKADYIVRSVITHWEPRAAAWSGIPTRATIAVSIIDAKTGDILINKELGIRGRALTLASQSAEGLARNLIDNFCKTIFN